MRWLEVVNTQASRLSSLERVLGTVFLRQVLLAEARHRLGPNPHERFRGLVVGRTQRQGHPYLLVRPQGLTAEAAEVIDAVLVPSQRRLDPGSVVEVEGTLEDPDKYDSKEGVLVRDARVDPIVPVEP